MFPAGPGSRVGVVLGGDVLLGTGSEVVDLEAAGFDFGGNAAAVLHRLSVEPAFRARLSEAVAGTKERHAWEEISLVAPVASPPSILGIARNYADHIAEMGGERPDVQTWFTKQPTAVVGNGEGIEIPRVSDQVDYEGELGVVIGRAGRHIPVERAREFIGGYTVINDVSVRDWQRAAPTMLMGKSFDTHAPMGPWIVTPDQVPDASNLRIVTRVNGEVRQDGTTADLIFTVDEMIAHLSAAFTLTPGLVLATGTPAGVGAASRPPRWLTPGDVVSISIEGVGTLTNPVVAEPEQAAGTTRSPAS